MKLSLAELKEALVQPNQPNAVDVAGSAKDAAGQYDTREPSVPRMCFVCLFCCTDKTVVFGIAFLIRGRICVVRPHCGSCRFCLSMTRFGGDGTLRKACKYRVCSQFQPRCPLTRSEHSDPSSVASDSSDDSEDEDDEEDTSSSDNSSDDGDDSSSDDGAQAAKLQELKTMQSRGLSATQFLRGVLPGWSFLTRVGIWTVHMTRSDVVQTMPPSPVLSRLAAWQSIQCALHLQYNS